MDDLNAGPFQTRLALTAEAVPQSNAVRESANSAANSNAASTAASAAAAAEAFEVIAITAGEGNGWQFSETALQASLALWDGVECFIDHAVHSRNASARSVRDLAGVLAEPRWDAARRGIRCRLRPVGPSAGLLSELGRQMVDASQPEQPRVGFSADVIFTAQGRAVHEIVRVLSVDLVLNPARGGAFLRAVPNPSDSVPQPSIQFSTPTGETRMTEETLTNTPVESAVEAQADPGRQLLEYTLSAARLPAGEEQRIRQTFSRRIDDGSFDAAALLQALDQARQLLADQAASRASAGVIQGPGRIHGMYSSEDKFTAALYDLLGAQRPAALEPVQAARLSGIRELYMLMTGDVAFAGGYDPERAQFSTSADLPVVLKNAMNRLIVQEWQELGRTGYRWWEAVTAVEHFNSLHDVTGMLVGEVTALPAVLEGDAYQPLAVADSGEVGAWKKYGGYIGLTLEMFERDETHRLRQYPRKLASAGLRRISALVGSIFTTAGGVGPNMGDGSPVFGAARGNLSTTALSGAAWEAASSAIYNQSMLVGAAGAAPKLALDARYLVVPRALRLTGRQILYPSWERESGIVAENMQRGEQGDVVTCPEFTDANDWAALADPRLAPGIIIAERFGLLPEIVIASQDRNGALFTNDEVRMKARHWLAVFVADYRPLYKANVA